MPMRRREKYVNGWVRFPVDDPRWVFSPEGGMFVRVMVLDEQNESRDDGWMECSGGVVTVTYDENGVMDAELERRLWPRLHIETQESDGPWARDKYESVTCLATLVLGSTGWAGYSEETRDYWKCGEDDLTDEGKELIAGLRRLYPGRPVVLTTWLDT